MKRILPSALLLALAFSSAAATNPDLGLGTIASDYVYANSFEQIAPLSDYDDLTEGFLGASFLYRGVSYHDVNDIGGVFPDGSTFTPDDVGRDFIIEDATDLFVDFPTFGSSPNVLTFGTSLVPGPNVTIGALVQASMDLAQPASAASLEAAFYENGPWGGIVLHLDAFLDGVQVATDSLTLSNLGGRDNVATHTFSISGVTFDALRFHATWDDQPTAPRVLIDNLRLTPAP